MADAAVTPHAGSTFPWKGITRGALGLLAVASIAAGVFMANYEPLVPGSGYVGVLGIRHKSPDTWGADPIDVITGRPGSFQVAFPIYNDGPLPITVTGIEFPSRGMETPIKFDDVRMAPADYDDTTSVPFEPTTIEPGTNLQLYIVGHLDGCNYGDAGLGWYSSQDVRYRVLGIPKVQTVQMHHRVGSSCPDPDAA